MDLRILTMAGNCINPMKNSTVAKIIATSSFVDYLATTIVTDIY